jgi:hypothetical protein
MEGSADAPIVGTSVGEIVGLLVVGDAVVTGALVGETEGTSEGDIVGEAVGASDGELLGTSEGDDDGTSVGGSDGELLGADDTVGIELGEALGLFVGGSVFRIQRLERYSASSSRFSACERKLERER